MQEIICPFCGSDCTYFSKKKKMYICEECEETFTITEESPEQKAQRIFFSYGHDANVPLVLKLKSDLEARGHFVWFDNSQISSGDNWRRSITEGLMSTSGVLSFLSKHSVRNPGVCLDELRIALCAKGSLVKTVLLEREDEVLPPSTLCDTQWLDMSDWRDQQARGEDAWAMWYAQKFSELCAVIESPESKNFSGEISWLRKLLDPSLSDSKEQYLLKQSFVGRDWLDIELETWRTSSAQSGAFLLIGGPGLGKSSFAAHVLHYNPRAVCGVYCEWDKPATTDAKSVIRTIAFKLATKLPDYRKMLMEQLQSQERVQSLHKLEASELFDILLTVPLSQLIDGGRDTCMIIIDGLDEAGQTQDNELARVLADNMNKLPTWLKLVLTSRPESDILAVFSAYNPRMLDPDEEQNIQDIVSYLALNLKDVLSTQNERVEKLRHIAKNCQGSFLYASLLVENILLAHMSIDDAAVFPPGLDAFYLQNFKRKFPTRSDYTSVRRAMELIVAAQSLPVSLLLDALGMSLYDYRDFTEQLGSLLRQTVIRERDCELKGVTFCHKSVVDWLIAPERSHTYFVDASAGVRILAEHCCRKIREDLDNDALKAYIITHVTRFLVQGRLWQKLEDFLLDPRTSLDPHWRALDALPATWKMDALIQNFWTQRDHHTFLLDMQRKGERSFIAFVLKHVVNIFGIGKLDIQSLQIYIDAVHLGGSYEEAASLCETYLTRYSLEEIVANKELLLIAIRRLHHSMFFAPVKDLIDYALEIEHHTQGTDHTREYNELLFLIGGNLGVLYGDFSFASKWNDLSLHYAQKHSLDDYQSRATRKKVDLLTANGNFDEALNLASKFVSTDCELRTRYQVYLLGSLGDIYRHKKMFDDSYACFSRLASVTKERGIPGWTAHAYLGLANLYLDFGYYDDALHHLDKARSIYNAIKQKWGQINSAITHTRLQLSLGNSVDKIQLKDIHAETTRLQYLYYTDVIAGLLEDKPLDFFPLLFL